MFTKLHTETVWRLLVPHVLFSTTPLPFIYLLVIFTPSLPLNQNGTVNQLPDPNYLTILILYLLTIKSRLLSTRNKNKVYTRLYVITLSQPNSNKSMNLKCLLKHNNHIITPIT